MQCSGNSTNPDPDIVIYYLMDIFSSYGNILISKNTLVDESQWEM